jgi:hypothetical protein
MMWSTHSRRIDPISRSEKPFCQGEAGAVGLSRMPMAHHQQRHALHRQGNGLAAGAAREHRRCQLWLAGGVCDVVALNATAALLAMFVIKPMRRAFILREYDVNDF